MAAPPAKIVQTEFGPAEVVEARSEPVLEPKKHADPLKRRHRGAMIEVPALVSEDAIRAATMEPTPCKTIGCKGLTTRSRGPLSNLCDDCAEAKRDLLSEHQSAMRQRDSSSYQGVMTRAGERVASLRWQLREAEAELERLVQEHHGSLELKAVKR